MHILTPQYSFTSERVQTLLFDRQDRKARAKIWCLGMRLANTAQRKAVEVLSCRVPTPPGVDGWHETSENSAPPPPFALRLSTSIVFVGVFCVVHAPRLSAITG